MKKSIKKTLAFTLSLLLLTTPIIGSNLISAENTENDISAVDILKQEITLSTKNNPEYFVFSGEYNEILVGFSEKGKEIVDTDINLVVDNVFVIGYEAFLENSQIKSVEFCEGVERIGEYSFKNNVNLKSIKMTNSVFDIGHEAFYNCFALEDVVYSCNDTTTSNYDRVFSNDVRTSEQLNYEGFNLSFDITTYHVNDDLEIRTSNFDELKLKNIVIPEGVVMLEDTFVDTEAVSISIPSTMTRMTSIPCNIDLEININNNAGLIKYFNGYFFRFGDVNRDDNIDNADLLDTAQYLTKEKQYTTHEYFKGYGESSYPDKETALTIAKEKALEDCKSQYNYDANKFILIEYQVLDEGYITKNEDEIETFLYKVGVIGIQYTTHDIPFYDMHKLSADINIDGVVDIADLALLKQHLMGDTVNNLE